VTHINLLDLFSGIGGFHLGLEQAGFEFDWVGFSEIDKYAKQTYKKNFPNSKDLGDVRAIRHQDLPQIDVITFGSPCQDFSIAGKRAGLDGSRSSLIGEAIRLIADCKPHFFIWENVKGTFSSNNGADFWAIIQAFTDIGGYRLEWQLLNTRWFLPQNRERIYLVGYLGEGSRSKIFPIGEDGETHNGSKEGAESKTELCTTISTREGGRKENNFVIVDKKLTKKNNQHYAANLSGGGHSGGNHSDMDLLKINIAGNLKGDGGHETGEVQVFTEKSFDGKREDGGRAIRYHKKLGESPCLSSQMGMGGNNIPMFKVKAGLHQVGNLQITAKKRTHDTPKEINEYLKANKGDKTIREIAESLELPKTQVEHYFRADKSRAIPSPEIWDELKALLQFDDTYDEEVTSIYEKEVEFESSRRVYSADGIGKTLDTNDSGLYHVKACLTPDRLEKRQNGRRFKEDGEPMFTLTGQDTHGVMIREATKQPGSDNSEAVEIYDDYNSRIRDDGVMVYDHYNNKIKSDGVACSLLKHSSNSRSTQKIINNHSIRRLTPTECERLQGFPDGWTEGQSDTQRYKQLGNAVSVPVVAAVGKKLNLAGKNVSNCND